MTQEEFAKIRTSQEAAEVTPRRGRKRQLEEMMESQRERREARGEILTESAIEVVDHAKKRLNKEERLSVIKVCFCVCVYVYVCVCACEHV